VTSLSKDAQAARELYEQLCCARGEMENRIKEAQLDLFADRLSTATFRSNQLRLWLAILFVVGVALVLQSFPIWKELETGPTHGGEPLVQTRVDPACRCDQRMSNSRLAESMHR
jgi:hypothetical protein